MRFGHRWMQGAASAALAIGASIAMTTWAEAACTPPSAGAVPGTTVTCTGATVNQDGTNGYGTGNETGITVNVGAGASIEATTDNGIWVADAVVNNGAGSTILGMVNGIVARTGSLAITNAGDISTNTVAGNYAIYSDRDITLNNTATGFIYGPTGGAWSGFGSLATENAGFINGGGGPALRSQSSLTMTNRAGGEVIGLTSAVISTAGSVTIDNAGLIDASGPAATAVSGFGDITVTNRAGGVISGTGRAIESQFGSISIDNAGTITSADPVIAVSAPGNVKLFNRAGATIDRGVISMGTTEVYNAGTIRAVGGQNLQVINTATGVIGGVAAQGPASEIHNFGLISEGGGFGALTNYAGGRIDKIISYNQTVNNFGAIGTIELWAASHFINNVGSSISDLTLAIKFDPSANGSSIFNAGTISGATAIRFDAGGNMLTIAPTSVITGLVHSTVAGNVLQLGGSDTGSFDISRLGQNVLTNQYVGFTAFNKVDSSLWLLTGTTTYNGPVNVNSGTLAVNGNLAAASLLTVNAGGTLGGNGTLGATVINGGTLAPGNSIGTLTIASLTMTAASTYLVETSGTLSDRTNVTGAAVLAGKVVVNPITRLTSTTTYTIFNAGTLTGTFDSASVASNFARNARLSYVGNDVLLTLDPGLLTPILPGNASINNRNVAAGIDDALERGAALTPSFNALFGLTGNNLLNALTQVSGETVTGSQQTTFDAMTQFMGVLSDPFTVGRGGTTPAMFAFAEDSALAYAPDGRKRTRAERDAFATFTKAPPKAYEARWSVWAAGFGGSRTTDGNTLLGSNRTTGNVGAAAVGADYWFSPETVAGFALAGGGTSFSVANGGSGQSDLFQAGAFVRHSIASSYITATAAYGWQDIRTDRLTTAVGTERLRANFNANAFSGRIEAGNRWLVPEIGGVGLTPYAAVQVIAFHLPSYAETALNGAGGFALNYSAETATATRTEVGLRGDKSWAMPNGVLAVRGRTAWAHDYSSDRNVSAVFQSLPGSTFIVNGAQPARNAALASASVEMNFNGGWSVAATFDGEFSDVSTSYAGKGVVRYAW